MTTETNTTESRTEETTEASASTVTHAVDNLVRIGRIWASHGIGIGRSALAASAETLRLASQTLDELKGRIDASETDRDSHAA